MPDAGLTGVDGLLDCHLQGEVTCERQILAARLFGDGEVRVARRVVEDLDQIHSARATGGSPEPRLALA